MDTSSRPEQPQAPNDGTLTVDTYIHIGTAYIRMLHILDRRVFDAVLAGFKIETECFQNYWVESEIEEIESTAKFLRWNLNKNIFRNAD